MGMEFKQVDRSKAREESNRCVTNPNGSKAYLEHDISVLHIYTFTRVRMMSECVTHMLLLGTR